MAFDNPTKEEIEYVCRKFDDEATMKLASLHIIIECGLYGKAHRYLIHFLEGTGNPIIFDFQQLLNDVPTIRNKIESEIKLQWRSKLKRGYFEISQPDFIPFSKKEKDWQYSIGGFRVHWRFIGGASHRFLLTVRNEYMWHPETMRGKRTECIHEAGKRLNRIGKAKNFLIMGNTEIRFNPDEPISIPNNTYGIKDLL